SGAPSSMPYIIEALETGDITLLHAISIRAVIRLMWDQEPSFGLDGGKQVYTPSKEPKLLDLGKKFQKCCELSAHLLSCLFLPHIELISVLPIAFLRALIYQIHTCLV
ncbi:hypothetical protein ACJX0J_027271, partial [Zea mays]